MDVDEQNSRTLLRRCLRQTLCERLLCLGILDHTGSDDDLVERIVKEVEEHSSFETMANTNETQPGKTLAEFQQRLRLANSTMEQIKAAGFLDVPDFKNQITSFSYLQDVVALNGIRWQFGTRSRTSRLLHPAKSQFRSPRQEMKTRVPCSIALVHSQIETVMILVSPMTKLQSIS